MTIFSRLGLGEKEAGFIKPVRFCSCPLKGESAVSMGMPPAQIWFLVGLVLVLAEFATPGVVLVFIGIGAWVASLTTWMGWTESLGGQMVVFAVSSLVLLVGLRRFFKEWFLGFSKANPNGGADLDEFVGKPVKVLTALSAGTQGRVEFKGTGWTAESADPLEPGEAAIITSVEGLCLRVKRKVG